jgi:hypothetical protein
LIVRNLFLSIHVFVWLISMLHHYYLRGFNKQLIHVFGVTRGCFFTCTQWRLWQLILISNLLCNCCTEFWRRVYSNYFAYSCRKFAIVLIGLVVLSLLGRKVQQATLNCYNLIGHVSNGDDENIFWWLFFCALTSHA